MTTGSFRCEQWVCDLKWVGVVLFPWFHHTYSALHVSSRLLVLTDVLSPYPWDIQCIIIIQFFFYVALLYLIEEEARLHLFVCFEKINIPHCNPFSITNTERWLSCWWLMIHTAPGFINKTYKYHPPWSLFIAWARGKHDSSQTDNSMAGVLFDKCHGHRERSCDPCL